VDTSLHAEQFLGLDGDAVTIPRMIKVLSEEFDPAGRRLLFVKAYPQFAIALTAVQT
jgi:hypothetical protein